MGMDPLMEGELRGTLVGKHTIASHAPWSAESQGDVDSWVLEDAGDSQAPVTHNRWYVPNQRLKTSDFGFKSMSSRHFCMRQTS